MPMIYTSEYYIHILPVTTNDRHDVIRVCGLDDLDDNVGKIVDANRHVFQHSHLVPEAAQ